MVLWKIVAQAKLPPPPPPPLLPFQGNAREGLVLVFRLLVAWHSHSNTSKKRTKKLPLWIPSFSRKKSTLEERKSDTL